LLGCKKIVHRLFVLVGGQRSAMVHWRWRIG
jgi:hypothetical protein